MDAWQTFVVLQSQVAWTSQRLICLYGSLLPTASSVLCIVVPDHDFDDVRIRTALQVRFCNSCESSFGTTPVLIVSARHIGYTWDMAYAYGILHLLEKNRGI